MPKIRPSVRRSARLRKLWEGRRMPAVQKSVINTSVKKPYVVFGPCDLITSGFEQYPNMDYYLFEKDGVRAVIPCAARLGKPWIVTGCKTDRELVSQVQSILTQECLKDL